MRARTARLALLAFLAAGAAGCAATERFRGVSSAQVDPASPVAKDVVYASEHPGPYPRFTDIPNVPTDIRPVHAWRAAILDLKQRKAVLDSEVADLPAPQQDTEGYAALHRAKVAAEAADAPPPDAAQQTEAYAQSLRERATPPPPPK